MEHARTLAELDTRMPPIMVQRETMRVIDGVHRFHAAKLRGQAAIEVRFYDGPLDDAFVLAVQLNVRHGLPLSRADRNAAARRIIHSHPGWSDRLIASIVGLSPKTVGAARVRSSEEVPQLRCRTGRDGRVRQVAQPRKPIRDQAEPADAGGEARHGTPGVSRELLSRLRRDPSLRMTELGRHLLRFLDVHWMSEEKQDQLVECVPPHCIDTVARLARYTASRWAELADALVEREPAEADPDVVDVRSAHRHG